MREEINNWQEQAEKDLRAAKNSLSSGDYEWAGFQAHQATEKTLKALYIRKFNKLLKTHDLVLLARKVGSPQSIILLCSKINPSYLDTRYPDIPKSYSETEAKEIVDLAEEVIKWIKSNL